MNLSGAIQQLSSGKQVSTAADNAAEYVVGKLQSQRLAGVHLEQWCVGIDRGQRPDGPRHAHVQQHDWSANALLTSTTGAQAAITAVQSALKTVSTAAGQLGAFQNEMTSVVSNLTAGQQNLQAANSQIVDTNMASEMTNFTSDQVLEQAGVAMLSQAQQSSQYVLKLLQ
jgi:flagellin-like hook-associated protein FlgL